MICVKSICNTLFKNQIHNINPDCLTPSLLRGLILFQGGLVYLNASYSAFLSYTQSFFCSPTWRLFYKARLPSEYFFLVSKFNLSPKSRKLLYISHCCSPDLVEFWLYCSEYTFSVTWFFFSKTFKISWTFEDSKTLPLLLWPLIPPIHTLFHGLGALILLYCSNSVFHKLLEQLVWLNSMF